MIFARYDPQTGNLTSIGATDDEYVLAEIAEGKPTIILDQYMDFAAARYEYKVDLNTKTLIKSASPKPVTELKLIPAISDRQFYQKAALDGYITREDALAAVQTGFIPTPLQEIIDDITDPDEKFNATMMFAGATVYLRQHPYTEMFGVKFGLSPEQLDTFWNEASKL